MADSEPHKLCSTDNIGGKQVASIGPDHLRTSLIHQPDKCKTLQNKMASTVQQLLLASMQAVVGIQFS